MQNFQKAYDQIMAKMINENLDGADQRYEVYEGSDEDIIYIADLENKVNDLQQRIMDGDHCVLKHIAFAEDLGEMGMNATVEDDIYLLDSPTDFTQPAFVLS
jgi:hypothetical protein